MWKVLYKGSLDRSSNDYEISVCRESNRHGMQSWGWGGKDKIILFASVIGANHLSISDESSEKFALAVADAVAETLNKNFQ